MFRPFIDEILTGRIRSCNHEGVQGINNSNFCIGVNQSVFHCNAYYFPEHNLLLLNRKVGVNFPFINIEFL